MKMRHLIPTGLILCSLLVSACDSTTKKSGQTADPTPISQVLKVLFGSLKPKPAATDIRKAITRQAIDASPTPVLLVGIETRNAFATLSPIGKNRGVITWVTAGGIGLGLNQGILTSTRGLGPDLMAADVRNVVPAVRGGRGTALRIHSYLDGENQTQRVEFRCSFRIQAHENLNIYGLKIATRHVVETCNNPETSIENHYWVSSSNRIWQSRQWVGTDPGYVFIQHLSR